MSAQAILWLALGSSLLGLALAAAGFRRAWAAGSATSGPAPALWRLLLAPVARRMRPHGKDLDRLLSALLQAGRQGDAEVERFLQEKVLGLILGATLGVGLCALAGGELGLLLLSIGVVGGLLTPRKLLERAAQARRNAVARNLPAAIDLLMTSVDAGLSVEQALSRVAREIVRSSPVLSEELGIAASECEAGVPLTESLRRLARRVELDDLSGLCGVIAQAHELGAPIVETLAEYADSSRKLRMAMLEERAGKLVTKLTLPLALFLLPAALVAILGPAAIQLIRTLN